MKTLTAKDARYCFGQMADFARVGPVGVSNQGRLIVVVAVVEQFERLTAPDSPRSPQTEVGKVAQ